MAAATESALRDTISAGLDDPVSNRTMPLRTPPTIQMSAPSPGDPMEVTTPTNSSAPPSATRSSDDEVGELSERSKTPIRNDQTGGGGIPAPAAAATAAAVHQPKIVQTAFIHKLYNMLEDDNIQHLISWTPSQESFVMQPSHDFSKVLAQYFKHTNISSFVRQLNMYGFHKVSDVFHHGTSETALWEFKHGNGNFKRGDLVGLREIKRRASRQALVHREYNSNIPKPPPTHSQPGTPAETMPPMPESGDPRVNSLEHTLYDVVNRLQRTEEMQHYMHIKHQTMMDTVARLLHFNQELSRTVLSLVPSPENPVHREVVALQGEMQRQAEMIRTLDEPHEPFTSGRSYLANVENAPVSPRQRAQDDGRRSSLAVPQPRGPFSHRPPIPSNLSLSTKRPYGSIGGGLTSSSFSSSIRPQGPPPPPGPQPHPLTMVEVSPNSLARRHTSADIRAHGWHPNHSPFASSGPPSAQWPSSPGRVPNPEDQRIRDSFSTYSLQVASQPHSRPATPPPPPPFQNGSANSENFSGWSWGSATRGENKNLAVRDSSAPSTRRGSMAHILNPTETAERDGEDEDDPRDDDRKRKRIS